MGSWPHLWIYPRWGARCRIRNCDASNGPRYPASGTGSLWRAISAARSNCHRDVLAVAPNPRRLGPLDAFRSASSSANSIRWRKLNVSKS